MDERIVQVAVPVPVRHHFDYLCPARQACPVSGQRVRVPFGARQMLGVVTSAGTGPAPHRSRLRTLTEVIDPEPLYSAQMIRVIEWAADYYHHPIGEVWHSVLPKALRRGRPAAPESVPQYRLTPSGAQAEVDSLRRAPAQSRLLRTMQRDPALTWSRDELHELAPSWRKVIQRLIELDWVEAVAKPAPRSGAVESPLTPTPAQNAAIQSVCQSLGEYSCHVLFGVTGSGKTEVYLRIIEAVLRQGRQALILVPEIALTPQLVGRFTARFAEPIAVLHSGLADGERHRAWWQAAAGEARIVIGTRSAVFTPLAEPGAIVVDEEHDPSYKQQDGFRYHARDVAVYRAKIESVPIVLGSATPSLETMRNVGAQRYVEIDLPNRPGGGRLPKVELVDLRRVPARGGLSLPIIEAIQARISAREQSLVFLNRRGFAPVLICPECGWQAQCPRCDARLTLHKDNRRLRCHHCGHSGPVPERCPTCAATQLKDLGEGTQKLEQALGRCFPTARVLRIDRDSVARKGALEEHLDNVRSGAADILVGTQLLTKGHDFPGVTLVAVLNADQGLFSADFRATEQLFQQIMQVAGRAGRGERPGQVLIQTLYPSHPQFAALCQHDYLSFVHAAMDEREAAGFPPFAHFALLRSESSEPDAPLEFLDAARRLANACGNASAVQVMDPIPAPMHKRAGRFRAQLLVSAGGRASLHAFLHEWLPRIETSPLARRVRWSVDVDPMEMC